MTQYIDKATLVAEIDAWRDKIVKGIFTIPLRGHQRADATFEYEILDKIRDFIDTFEVKEVDLEKEIDLQINKLHTPLHYEELKNFTKHFFELGLKAKNRDNE